MQIISDSKQIQPGMPVSAMPAAGVLPQDTAGSMGVGVVANG